MVVSSEPQLTTRPGTSDEMIAHESAYPRLWPYAKNAVVLDLGSYIGTTVRAFANAGANHIIACEPDLDNFSLLFANTAHLTNVSRLQVAVTGYPRPGLVQFWRSPDNKFSAGHTLRQKRGYHSVMVAGVYVNDLIKMFNPTVLKVDVENVEAQIVLAANLSHVTALAVEWSFIRKEDKPICQSAHQRLLDVGFKILGTRSQELKHSSVITYARDV